jgi:ABC-2 type transport system permease protein
VFRSIYLKTLRDYRIAIVGWGVGMGLVMVSTMASVSTLVSTPEARAALLSVAATYTWNADPVAVTTVGGYATFKVGIFIYLIAVWPLLAASRLLRGEEERASLDVLLSTPRGRVRVAVEKLAAMWTALLLMGVIIGLLAFAGGRKFNADFGLGDALLFGANVALICAVIGGVALLISQFTVERGPAAGTGAGLLLVFIVVDMVHRLIPHTDWISRFSPVYYYNLSKPLIPSYGANVGAMLLLLLLAAALGGAAIWLFVHRDVGDVVPVRRWLRLPERADRPASALPAREWSLGSVYRRSLGMIATPTIWWTLGIAGGAAWMVVAVQQIAERLKTVYSSSPFLTGLLNSLGGGGSTFYDSLLSAIFGLLVVLLMAFAVTQVNRWTADEDEGRLELVLATPQPRLVVLLGRFGALATATVLISVVTLAATVLTASLSGVPLDQAKLAAAVLGMIPMALFIAAIGYLGAGWFRTAADTGLLSFLLAAWFFISFVGPELKLPDATLRLSVFYYYGTPLLHGLRLADMLVIVGVGAAALVLALLRFSRKDIGT